MQTYPQRPNTFQSYLVPQVVYPRNTDGFNLQFPSLPVTRDHFNQQVGKKKDIPRLTHHLSYGAFINTVEKIHEASGLYIRDAKVDVIHYLTKAPIHQIVNAVKAFVGDSTNTDNLRTLIDKFRHEQIAGRLTMDELVEFLRRWDFYNPQTLSHLVQGCSEMDYDQGTVHTALLVQLTDLLHEHAAELRPRFRDSSRPAVPLNLDNLHSLLYRIDKEMQIYQDDVVALERIYDDNQFVTDVQQHAEEEDEEGWKRV